MSSTNHLAKLSQDVLLVLGEFLDTASLRAAAQVKPLNYAATWTLYHDDAKYGWGPEKHTRALSWGAYKGYECVVRMALRMKSSVAESPFYDGREYSVQGNAMHVAASQGHNHILQILMDHGGDVDSWTRVEKIAVAPFWALDLPRSMSPLYNAIDAGHEHTVEFLLDRGASLVVGKPDSGKPCVPSSQRRLNAMHIAAKHGRHRLVRHLHLQRGIDVNLSDQWGNTALAYAMGSSGNLRVIDYLVSEGADLDLMDDGGLTPLHRAVALPGAEPIVAALIEAGADVDAFTHRGQETPLTIAIRLARSSLIAMLVDAGACVGPSDLCLALRVRDPDDEARRDVVDALLRRGFARGSEEFVRQFLQENSADAAEVLYSRGLGLPDESPEGVNSLLQDILDQPSTGSENTSLTFLLTHYRDTIRGSKPEKAMAKLLANRHMSNRAMVSLMNLGINTRWRGKENKTLLHTFAETMRWHTRDSDFSVLQALLDRGVDVNARARGGLTALHILVANNHISSGSDQVWFADVLDRLLARGLDINAVDNRGWTALHHLANSQVIDRCVTRVEALVQRGIDPHVRDRVASQTALDVLLEYRQGRTPQTIQEYTAIVSSYHNTRTTSPSRHTTRTRLAQSARRPNSTPRHHRRRRRSRPI